MTHKIIPAAPVGAGQVPSEPSSSGRSRATSPWLILVGLGDVAQWPQGGEHGRDEAVTAVDVEV